LLVVPTSQNAPSAAPTSAEIAGAPARFVVSPRCPPKVIDRLKLILTQVS
jgi:hypothetical protein